jgi:hypothetical protein
MGWYSRMRQFVAWPGYCSLVFVLSEEIVEAGTRLDIGRGESPMHQFRLFNHLGEFFEGIEVRLDDTRKAGWTAKAMLERCAAVEVWRDNRLLLRLPADSKIRLVWSRA